MISTHRLIQQIAIRKVRHHVPILRSYVLCISPAVKNKEVEIILWYTN